MDPKSDAYAPTKPILIVQRFTAAKLVQLTWVIYDSEFDSVIIERKTTQDTSFVQLVSLPKTSRAYVDTSAFFSYPMSYRISPIYRRDGKEFKTSSQEIPVNFGTIGKPTLTYNSATRAMDAKFANTFKIPFQVEYWVKRPGMDTYEKIATLPGPASNVTQSVAVDHEVFRLDVAVVYSIEANNHRSVIDSISHSLPIHYPRSVIVTPMTEALGRVVWTNPYDFHEDIVVKVKDDEWILPDTTTSMDLTRYFRSSVTYDVTVQYRKDGEVSLPASIQKTMSITAPSIAFLGPGQDPILRISSSSSANSVYALGEYYVLEMSKNMTPYIPIDSAKVTATSHLFTVTGLDTTSIYMFRGRSLTSGSSTAIRLQPRFTYGHVIWDGIPNANTIRHFSPYDDLYVKDDQPSSAGVYDFNTHLKLFDVPLQGSDRPNGFTNKGGYLARISSTSNQTTLRHYSSDGSHSGNFVIPSTAYIMGNHDDVLFFDLPNRALKRVYLPTQSTTDIPFTETSNPGTQSAVFATFENSFAVKTEKQLHLYSYSETDGYVLSKSIDTPPYSSTLMEMIMTETHVILRLQLGIGNYFWYTNRETGSFQTFSRNWTGTFQVAYLGGYKWLRYYGHESYLTDLISNTETKQLFYPQSTAFTPQRLHRVRNQTSQPEILLLRTSTLSTLPYQLVWLKYQKFWVQE